MKSTTMYVSLRIALAVLMLLLLIPYAMNIITFHTWQILAYLLLAGNFTIIALRFYKNPAQGATFAVILNGLMAVIFLMVAFFWLF